ncbi:NAD(P)-dependent oxidoreductase [bacterium]|nr:NAD(P)-dependent oxidoreductase [candidate division CSSED10-310 bacterium]
MELPGMVLTGASGFLGRHFLDVMKRHHKIFAIARRSQVRCNAPVHVNIHWYQVDIADLDHIESVFREIRREGGAESVVHFAAYYDFTGEEHPDYYRSNVNGLRNILKVTKILHPKRFIFSSSVAACSFPKKGHYIDETSPPDGSHIYAVTKALGESLVSEFSDFVPTSIVRLPALFSDWCEYPPLFMFLQTWLSEAWNSRILGGTGLSAIPYLHVRDAVSYFRTLLLDYIPREPCEIFIAGGDGATSHLELYNAATLNRYGSVRKPRLMPRPLCGLGMWMLEILGQLRGKPPFERSWMAAYIDKQLSVNASKSRTRLSWQPRPRLGILRRMPFLIENFKSDPIEWMSRNQAAMKMPYLHPNLRIYRLLQSNEDAIVKTVINRIFETPENLQFERYRQLGVDQQQWASRQAFRELMTSVRTLDKGVFMKYCTDIACHRRDQGYRPTEVIEALSVFHDTCMSVLRGDPDADDLSSELVDNITMTVQFGIDQVEEVFEEVSSADTACR